MNNLEKNSKKKICIFLQKIFYLSIYEENIENRLMRLCTKYNLNENTKNIIKYIKFFSNFCYLKLLNFAFFEIEN